MKHAVSRPSPRFRFPDRDLIETLVDIYFSEFNIYMPLLHRPTFLDKLRKGQHLGDAGFGCTVLLVCAVGARFSDDPRVLLKDPDEDEQRSRHSAGWDWFCQVQDYKALFTFAPATLADLQMICVSCVAAASLCLLTG